VQRESGNKNDADAGKYTDCSGDIQHACSRQEVLADKRTKEDRPSPTEVPARRGKLPQGKIEVWLPNATIRVALCQPQKFSQSDAGRPAELLWLLVS
jgi:hypothetical protein